MIFAIGILGTSVSPSVFGQLNDRKDGETPTVALSIAARFGSPNNDEIPDFQKHISPLLGRLGCNGRACHGSFQGQGGFMLSLFGYDFDADHRALVDDSSERVVVQDPQSSLILRKPTGEESHDGGIRFERQSWEYNVLNRWVQAGAKKQTGVAPLNLIKLEVTPSEILFPKPGDSASLHVVAHWSDGVSEDVTGISRFASNDTAIAQVDVDGRITGGEVGDTHIVVSYDNAVVPVVVLRPFGASGQLRLPIENAENQIDKLVLKKLDKLGIIPSAPCSDEEFLRRISLDMTGNLPSPDDVESFVIDPSSDKRNRIIEQLLDSPGYAALWTTVLCDITGNNDAQLQNFSFLRDTPSQQWYQWIYARVANNTPYDQLVEGIVTAVSREPSETYREYCETMTQIARDTTGKAFANRSTLMYYWARQNQRTAEDRAVAFAYTFCGIRIQCAQCHKHPFDQWSKRDFDQFEKIFEGIQANQNSFDNNSKKEFDALVEAMGINKSTKGGQLAREIQDKFKSENEELIVPFPEVFVKSKSPPRGTNKKNGKEKKKADTTEPHFNQDSPKILGGDYVDLARIKDPRTVLMDWLRSPDNPYFARAIVNRVWAHYFHVGIVNPVDDLNRANAPSNSELLDYLSTEFVRHKYDLKWLHRTIVESQTYQRSWKTNETNEFDRRNFSHALLRRLPAETAFDAIRIALSSDSVAQSLCRVELDRAMTVAGASAATKTRTGGDKYALSVFGRSIRETNCDCDRTSDPSLLQTVFIRNDADVLKALTDPKTSWLAQIADENQWSIPTSLSNVSAKRPMDQEAIARQPRTIESLDKEVDDTDRKIRTLKVQLEKQKQSDKLLIPKSNPSDQNDSEVEQKQKESIARKKELKSRLAFLEKKMVELDAARVQLQVRQSIVTGVGSSDPVLNEQIVAHRRLIDTLVTKAFLRTLSRYPNAVERNRSTQSVLDAENPIVGLSDLLWALINSKEFILNH